MNYMICIIGTMELLGSHNLKWLSKILDSNLQVQQAAELKDGPQLIVPELEHSQFV